MMAEEPLEDDDPELKVIAIQLKETASYAIDPDFLGELGKKLFLALLRRRLLLLFQERIQQD